MWECWQYRLHLWSFVLFTAAQWPPLEVHICVDPNVRRLVLIIGRDDRGGPTWGNWESCWHTDGIISDNYPLTPPSCPIKAVAEARGGRRWQWRRIALHWDCLLLPLLPSKVLWLRSCVNGMASFGFSISRCLLSLENTDPPSPSNADDMLTLPNIKTHTKAIVTKILALVMK